MKIFPRQEIYGVYTAPSDKAVTQNAIILGAIAKGRTFVVHPLYGSDTQAAINCARKLGAKIKVKSGIIEIKGAKALKGGKFDCLNSGATMRMMCGVASGAGLNAVLTGGKYLTRRLMRGVKEPLEKMGATVALTDYSVAPIWVEGAMVRPIEYEMPSPSSQVKSAVLLCALLGKVKATVTEKIKTANHMEILLKEMGASISWDENSVTLSESEIVGKRIYISGDFSSAIYLLASGLLSGKVTVKNVGVNPTRTAVLNVLKRMGAKIEITNKRLLCGELIADLTAYRSELKATHVTGEEANLMENEITVLSVLMGVAEGESIIGCDEAPIVDNEAKFENIKEMINSIGGNCKTFENGLVIKGVKRYRGGSVKTYGDHRIAISASVALMASENGGEIDDDGCVNVSFPNFFDKYKRGNIGVVGKGRTVALASEVYFKVLGLIRGENYGCTFIDATEDNLKRAFSELRTYDGYAVYAPYSAEALRHIIKLVGHARIARTINAAMSNKGYSTDGDGVVAALKYNNIFGTGNAARSIVCSMVAERAFVDVYDRDLGAAIELAKRLGSGVEVLMEVTPKNYDIIINATPVGSGYYEGESLADEESVKASGTVVDLAVAEGKTKIVEYAEKNGVNAIDGECVMFFTVYYAACILTGKMPTEEEAFKAYTAYLRLGDGSMKD